jgi:hypothetical protein
VAETLKVDPHQLATLARNLAVMVWQARGLVPADTVRPAGGDPISMAGAERLSSRGAQLANRVIEGLNKLTPAAYAIGAAGELYSGGDTTGADAIASTGLGTGSAPASEVVRNPVGPWAPIPVRDVPPVSIDVPADLSDPETFAKQLVEQGDGGSSARTFSGSWRNVYVGAAHPMTDQAVVETANGTGRWEPVGAQKVAPLFAQFRAWHDEVGFNYAAALSQQADDYVGAFNNVRAAHPKLAEVKDAKQRYEMAMPGPEKTAALVDLMRVYQRSWQAQQQYRMAIESAIPNGDIVVAPPPDIASPTIAAVDNDIVQRQAARGAGAGSGGNQTRNGSPIKGVLSGLLKGLPSIAPLLTQLLESTGDTTLPTGPTIEPPFELPVPPPPSPPTPSIQDPARSGGIPQIPDLSQLADPGLNEDLPSDDGLLEEPYLEDPLLEQPYLDDYAGSPGYTGGGLGGGGGGGGVSPVVGGVPLSRTANLGAPKRSVARQFGAPTAGGRAQPGVGGGTPYMPFMPGMGGANPNAGARKNPFAVEEKIVDDDELRSKVLASATVNEKPPVLPPDATRPTVDKTVRNQPGATT